MKPAPKKLLKIKARFARQFDSDRPIFAKQKYMLNEEYSMLDVAIAPLLWRLSITIFSWVGSGTAYEIRRKDLSRKAYIDSMTPAEKRCESE